VTWDQIESEIYLKQLEKNRLATSDKSRELKRILEKTPDQTKRRELNQEINKLDQEGRDMENKMDDLRKRVSEP
jgi:hypothetical protein